VIRRAVLLYVKYPLSLRNVEDLLFERGIDITHETVRFWWNRFGPLFAGEIRRRRVSYMRGFRQWRWHLDEMYVKMNGEMRYLWRAVDHEGEILESFAKDRNVAAARAMKVGLRESAKPRGTIESGASWRFQAGSAVAQIWYPSGTRRERQGGIPMLSH
jgi:putative transposase